MLENKNINYIFVYGTLRSKGSAPAHVLKHLKEDSVPAGKAYFPGKLFLAKTYPAATEEGSTHIKGDLLRLKPWKKAKLLKVLDDYEGEEFTRVPRKVYRDKGNPVEAWVYLWGGDASSLTPIDSGEWCARRAAKRYLRR